MQDVKILKLISSVYNNLKNSEWGQYVDNETIAQKAIDIYNDTIYKEESLAEEKRQFDANLQYDATGSTKLSNGTTVAKVANATSNTKIPDYVMDKVKSFSTNDDLNSYLESMESQGIISQEQGDSLYETYKNTSLTGNNWTMKDDGGVNWLGGKDKNAVVSYGGKDYTIKQLYNGLIAEGMSKSDANDYIKKLQKKLGI